MDDLEKTEIYRLHYVGPLDAYGLARQRNIPVHTHQEMVTIVKSMYNHLLGDFEMDMDHLESLSCLMLTHVAEVKRFRTFQANR